MDVPAIDISQYDETESRIAWFTLLLGCVAAIVVWSLYGGRWGGGILVGAVLAWLNFRWLKEGLDAFTQAATVKAGQTKVRVPLFTYFTAAFRYGLIGLMVYVTFRYLNVPVLSMVFGLCSLGAATLVVSVHEILRHQE